jgi:hypothetical protein
MKHTYHGHCVNYYNGILNKSNRPIIYTMVTISMVLQKNQRDLSYTLCFLLEWYCRQIKETYHRHCANYENGIVDKSNSSINDNALTIRMVLQNNQTDLSYTLCFLY